MKKKYVKMWGEHISLFEFFLSFLISISSIILFLIIEKVLFDVKEYRLLFGLIGLVIAFIINVVLFKPKRNVVFKEQANDN